MLVNAIYTRSRRITKVLGRNRRRVQYISNKTGVFHTLLYFISYCLGYAYSKSEAAFMYTILD